MTENFESSPNRIPAPGNRESMRSPELPITLNLPLAMARAIALRMKQSGKTQAQVILEALASSFVSNGSAEPVNSAREELELLKRRLAELEGLIPKVAMLEGKSIAF
ncbi:MAG: hypothetical protein HY785_24055 [Oscillatoriophycideae cyanobacterium NC_groundwater_1537_Pr4_S-0.65um_50_18]|nr:hypothetical protein [Oscillatoriophycideae cyanobacterium NC_groundwater_1537_Pr4_S-0.65um_50_18]